MRHRIIHNRHLTSPGEQYSVMHGEQVLSYHGTRQDAKSALERYEAIERRSKRSPDTRRVLGHTFRPFDKQDWYAFAGADPGSLICYTGDEGDPVLILSPSGNITEVPEDGPEVEWTRGGTGGVSS